MDEPTETCQANARLIAVAPELLRLLNQALHYIPNEGDADRDLREEIEDMITKAEGRR